MHDNKGKTIIQARKENLVVKEVADEVLIYDLDANKAHCLNKTAALVWNYCDGKNSVTDVARRMASDLQTPVDETVVWFAINQLEKFDLMQEQKAKELGMGMTRRDLIKRAGIAAVLTIPVVMTITAPNALAAVSCVDIGGACTTTGECCQTPLALTCCTAPSPSAGTCQASC
ncbi:MAG: PqqD family protein [Acidobacteriota bacterium]